MRFIQRQIQSDEKEVFRADGNCDFDSADFYLASYGEEYHLKAPVTYHCDEDLSEVYDSIDYSRGIMYSGKSMVYRETDIISDDMRVKTEYYQKVYKPNNWHYSLQMIMTKERSFLEW